MWIQCESCEAGVTIWKLQKEIYEKVNTDRYGSYDPKVTIWMLRSGSYDPKVTKWGTIDRPSSAAELKWSTYE